VKYRPYKGKKSTSNAILFSVVVIVVLVAVFMTITTNDEPHAPETLASSETAKLIRQIDPLRDGVSFTITDEYTSASALRHDARMQELWEMNPEWSESAPEVIATAEIIPPHLTSRPNSRYVPEYMVYFTIPHNSAWITNSVQEHLVEQCRIRGVPVRLAWAIIWTESHFRPQAIAQEGNGTSSHGLMQINSSNHRNINAAFGRSLDYLCPYDNISAGIYWLGMILDAQDGDWHRSLMSYHQGGASAARSWRAGYSTSSYSWHVIQLAAELEVRERVF